MIKKIFSVSVATLLVLSTFLLTANAESYVDRDFSKSSSSIIGMEDNLAEISKLIGKSQTRTVSEYDMIKGLQQKTDSELKNIGYSAQDIKNIRQPLKASNKYGNVTYTINYTSMYQKKGITYLTTKMTWNWSKKPAFLLTDIAALTNSENFTKVSATSFVQYYTYGNKSKKNGTASPTVSTKDSGRGAFIKIQMGKDYDRELKEYKKVALSGSVTVTWSISGKYKQTGISSNYGHSVLTCTPSVSFGYKSGAISFTPAKRCKSGDEAYMIAKVK